MLVATSDPTRILLIKGNQPLEARYHAARGLVAYASESEILEGAIGADTGWEIIESAAIAHENILKSSPYNYQFSGHPTLTCQKGP